ncbi:glycosyltransferase [Photobacterium carnosum]|uniref:glycosyltransferase n=1 Tax=Photobacterium carnosum TaxID=2023717 RepID=UPI001F1A976F|nr:glycosyltransferase [Photobacterium carnosum]MCF2305197.1 glycosyltransferase [Photobacterium carnosum]
MEISIIIPVFNSDKYIKKCINSILEQSYSCLEVIIVNDGSTDNTRTICQELAINDSRIKYFEIENSGPAVARNYGLSKATGDYVGFVDADDTIDANMYQTMINAAEINDLDIVMCGYRTVSNIDTVDIRINIPCQLMETTESIKENIIKRYYFGDSEGIASLCNKIYKRKFLEQHNLRIDETRVRAEDYWFNLNAFMNCERFIFINECFYNYFNVNDSSVMKSFRINQFELFLETRNKLIESNENVFLFDGVNARLDKDVLYSSLEYLHIMMLTQEFSIVIDFVNKKEFMDILDKSNINLLPRYYCFLSRVLSVKNKKMRLVLLCLIFASLKVRRK